MTTRSLGLLGTSLLVALAAACGDDGNNSGSCGDGHITGSETCDDGNSASGDGCSSSCRTEGTCGNGTLEPATETCDDSNTTPGDGCSSTCQTEGDCGNGVIDGAETCDDGNTTSLDGCNAACGTEIGWTCTGTPSVCTMGGGGGGGTCAAPGMITLTASGADLEGMVTGDTTGAPGSIPEAQCGTYPAGAGNDNIWTFTTTDTRDVLLILTPNGDFDPIMRVMSACDATTGLDGQFGPGGCGDFGLEGEEEYLAYVNLPAGTYYVSVEGYDAMFFGSYSLSISATVPGCGDGSVGLIEQCDDGNTTNNDGCTSCLTDDGYNCDTSEPSVCEMEGCGDGILQMGEECDDDNIAPSDGCSAICEVEDGFVCVEDSEPSVCVAAGCGNGIIESPTEECDDGNTDANDRCGATCLLEFDVAASAEPNNTVAQTLTAGNHIIKAQFQANDVDLYTFTLANMSAVTIESYSTLNGDGSDYTGLGAIPTIDCLNDTDDTEIAIFPMGVDTTNDANALYIDDDDGDFFCSYLGEANNAGMATLAAGTYIIRVQESPFATNTPDTRYMLDVSVVPAGSGAVAPAAGDLKINEFFAADGGATNGGIDSNCDGSLADSSDEFIELVNVSNKLLDLTGVTYSDADGVKFTFAAQTTGNLSLAPGKAVVLWGGGAPACAGVDNFFIRGTSKTLSLNDAGDTITIATGGMTPVTIATTTYTTALAPVAPATRKSANLDPDKTGTAYILHPLVSGTGKYMSPGMKTDGTPFQ
jgi:cysteine-rich repeat protein